MLPGGNRKMSLNQYSVEEETRRYFVDEEIIRSSGAELIKRFLSSKYRYEIEVDRRLLDTTKSSGAEAFFEYITKKFAKKKENGKREFDNVTLTFEEKPNGAPVIVNDPRKQITYEEKGHETQNARLLSYKPSELLERGLCDINYNGKAEDVFEREELEKMLREEPVNNQKLMLNGNPSLIYEVKGNLKEVDSKNQRYMVEEGSLRATRKEEFKNGFPEPRIFNIAPRNFRQSLLLQDILLNDDIEFGLVSGGSGSGKTILAYAAAIDSVLKNKKEETPKYENVIIMKPNNTMGGKNREIGFMPGDMEGKYGHIIKSFEDVHNMIDFKFPFEEFLKHPLRENDFGMRRKDFCKIDERLIPDKLPVVELEVSNFVRGRTFENKYILVDEVQNYTPYEAKQILERVGVGSKIIFMGDIEQLDDESMSELKKDYNGLTYGAHVAISQDHPRYGSLALDENYRSQTAELTKEVRVYKG